MTLNILLLLLCTEGIFVPVSAQAFMGTLPNGSRVLRPNDGQQVIVDGIVMQELLQKVESMASELSTLRAAFAAHLLPSSCEQWQLRNQTNFQAGSYTIQDGAGNPVEVFCYPDEQGVWTRILGPNVNGSCTSFWHVEGTFDLVCNVSNVTMQSFHNKVVGALILTTGSPFRHIRFAGRAFTSGGSTFGPVMFPSAASARGFGTFPVKPQGYCADNRDYQLQTYDLGSSDFKAAWRVSNPDAVSGDNVCGGANAYWTLNQVEFK